MPNLLGYTAEDARRDCEDAPNHADYQLNRVLGHIRKAAMEGSDTVSLLMGYRLHAETLKGLADQGFTVEETDGKMGAYQLSWKGPPKYVQEPSPLDSPFLGEYQALAEQLLELRLRFAQEEGPLAARVGEAWKKVQGSSGGSV